ncbi:hypothetical protein V2G26_019841 [Clonostachys chloroleuca]
MSWSYDYASKSFRDEGELRVIEPPSGEDHEGQADKEDSGSVFHGRSSRPVKRKPEQVNMVVIRWEWLSFLVIQVALALVFQVVVVAQTARLGVDIVKSSNIAELFALQGSGDKYMDDSLSRGISTTVTDEQYGELVKDTHGWKLHLSTG